MVEDETIKKGTNKFKITIKKWVEDSGDYLMVKISISEKLKKLLSKFAVIGDEESERDCDNYFMDISEEEAVKRYLIKNMIAGSNFWNGHYEVFFSKNLIDCGEVTFECRSVERYKSMLSKLNNFKNLIVEMVESLDSTPVDVTYTVNVGEKNE